MTLVHRYQGREFSAQELLFLQASFHESYTSAIRRHAEKSFLVVYESAKPIRKTFGEFDRDVFAVVKGFQSNGKSPRFFVSIAHNSYRHLVYLIAALINGMTICPINPAEGSSRIAEKIESLGVEAVIYGDTNYFKDAKPMDLFADISAVNNEARALIPGQPLICVFTSGSTGYSKLVEQMEESVLANVDALIGHHRLDHDMVMATSMPVFHVSALIFSFLGALLSGATLILYSSFDLATVSESLERDKVQILSVVPILLQMILARREDFSAILGEKFKYVISGASALTCSAAMEFMQIFNKPVIQGYGLSEAIQSSTCMPVDLAMQDYQHWLGDFKHPSIGVELRGNEVLVLDMNDQPAAVGMEGEICIRGFNVMRAYRGVDASIPLRGGFLRTGDSGYFQLDKNQRKYFFVSGRKKDVIKRLSETISLQEVDDLVARTLQPGETAISVGFPHEIYGEEIGLVVHLIKPTRLQELKKDLLAIPFYMRPKVILQGKENFKTSSGKTQRWKSTPLFEKFFSEVFSADKGPLDGNDRVKPV